MEETWEQKKKIFLPCKLKKVNSNLKTIRKNIAIDTFSQFKRRVTLDIKSRILI